MDKHKIMHSGKKNSSIIYKREGSELIIATEVVKSWATLLKCCCREHWFQPGVSLEEKARRFAGIACAAFISAASNNCP